MPTTFSRRDCEHKLSRLDLIINSKKAVVWFCVKVLNGSRVVQGSRRIPRVHHFSLATVNTDTVVRWTRRHIGPPTSLSEPRMSRTITLSISQRGIFCVTLRGLPPLRTICQVATMLSSTLTERECLHILPGVDT